MMQGSISLSYTVPPIAFVSPIRMPQRHSMDIKLSVCRVFGITMHELIGPKQGQKYAQPRCAAYYLMKQRTNLSLTQIAQSLGRTDHSTVLSGIERAKSLIDHCPEFAGKFARAAG